MASGETVRFGAARLRFALLASILLGALSAPAGALARAGAYPVIHVLSTRADLVSGGEALVAVTMPDGAAPRRVTVWLNGRRVRRGFARRQDGVFEGLLSGLHVGENVLAAVLPGGRGARITITDHSVSGPVFAGPEPEPWTCEPGAVNRKTCFKPTAYSYWYLPKGGAGTDANSYGLEPYDPAHPPSDVAMTTTDQGVTVPFIVRQEIAYQDRDQVMIQALWQPGRPWTPWAAQRQWNHKLFVMGGVICHGTYGYTPSYWGGGNLVTGVPGSQDISVDALGLGFIDMSTSLANSAVDCNPARQAESLQIAKEHIVDQYGPIRFTIAYGCSGGSLMIQWVANAYPGIFQGLIPECAFPDAGSTAQQIVDYEALGNYFQAQTSANPPSWTQVQEAEVEGTGVEDLPISNFDATESASSFFPLALPSNCTDYDGYDTSESYVPGSERYNPVTNPGGVRCGLLDWNINLLGRQPRSVWDRQEREVGHGFAAVPIDDVGVQYGLGALEKGEITPAQFAGLNAQIGGFNVDWQPVAQRIPADEPALGYAYRSGFINEANNLDQVAILDLMGPNDPGLAHDTFREFALQARLQRDFGTSANLVIWQGPEPLFADVNYASESVRAMDRWLDAVWADHSHRPLARKIIADKPSDIHDQCTNGTGTVVLNTLCPRQLVPVYGTPRTVAGEPVSTDQNSCQLVPLKRSSYDVSFTAAEWAELQRAFPSGVCDYSLPGREQRPTVPWLTYQTASGQVIYGGRPLPRPPVSRRCQAAPRPPGACEPLRRR
jgi:hypothetical protein